MAYNPVSGAAIQYSKANGEVADGYYLKFYIANTTTPLSMATDSTGSTLLTKCKLNDKGYPITNPLDNDSIFIPYVDQSYRFVLYQNETDADANDTASADVNISEVAPLTEAGGILTRVDSVEDVAGFVGSTDGQQVSLKGWHPNSDVGGGILYWDSSLAKSNHNGGTVFSPTVPWTTTTADYLNAVGETDPAGNGCWVRKNVREMTTFDWGLEQGGADNQKVIDSALRYTPDYSTLYFTGFDESVEVDSYTTVGEYLSTLHLDHPLTVIGDASLPIKLKDFSTPWQDLGVGEVVSVLTVTSSDCKVSGLHIDANADNHYEIIGVDKYWEQSLTSKRPPNGIVVKSLAGATVERVEVFNNVILRPRAGVTVDGNVGSSNETDFTTRSLTTDFCSDVRVYGNEIDRPRSNAVIFISGVYDSFAYENVITDAYYHSVRFYYAVIGCSSYENKTLTDYSRMEALYNATDNGYWRTTDTGDSEYLIRRTGYRTGSGFADSSVNGGNVKNCHQHSNSIEYAVNVSAIIDDNESMSALSLISTVLACTHYDNTVINAPYIGMYHQISNSASDGNTENRGCSFHKNRIVGAKAQGLLNLANGGIFENNHLEDCAQLASEPFVEIGKPNSVVVYNDLVFGASTDANAAAFRSRTDTADSWISDNKLTGSFVTEHVKDDDTVANYGSNANTNALTLLNGWTQSAISGVDTAAYQIYLDGYVRLVGTVDGSTATNDQISQLPSSAVPTSLRACRSGSLTTGLTIRVTTSGNLRVANGERLNTVYLDSVQYRL